MRSGQLTFRGLSWLVISISVLSLCTASRLSGGQPVPPGGEPRVEVVFEVQTSTEEIGGSTDDQITILFCNTSGGAARPPRPLFNEDIVAEFSFSGREARPGATFSFKRFVTSTAFLNARFIRVVNHGVDGWAGSTLSMSVNGRRLLDRQSLYPRLGASNRSGIEKYNPGEWYERVYWEADFQRLRAK